MIENKPSVVNTPATDCAESALLFIYRSKTAKPMLGKMESVTPTDKETKLAVSLANDTLEKGKLKKAKDGLPMRCEDCLGIKACALLNPSRINPLVEINQNSQKDPEIVAKLAENLPEDLIIEYSNDGDSLPLAS